MTHLLTILTVLSVGLLTLLSAAEGALFALTREDREQLRHNTSRAARTLKHLLETPRDFAFTVEVGHELLLVVLTFVLVGWSLEFSYTSLHPLFLLTPPVLLCLQILPRAVAARSPLVVAMLVAIPVQLVDVLLLPVLRPVRWLTGYVLDRLGIPSTGGHHLEESEFKTLVDIGEKEGTLREQERDLIHNVFEFGDMVVSEAMTPRTEVVGFALSTPVEKILERIRDARFARVPIFKTSLDNIIGVLYTKDLLRFHSNSELAEHCSLQDLLRKVYFVPITKKLDELFREFQLQKIHMAVVVDEYGGVAGVITMDDLLSQLFGEILDEHDVEEHLFSRLQPDALRVVPQMDLEQLYELMDLPMPEDETVSTVGGFVVARFGTLPRKGEVITVDRLEFTVGDVDGTRLQSLVVRKLPPPDEEET